MRKILIILLLLFSVSKMHASFWYTWEYEFSHITYRESILMGSEYQDPQIFPFAVRLNACVKELVDAGKLENKRIIFDFDYYNSRIKRQRYMLEVYQTKEVYYIHTGGYGQHRLLLSEDELLKILAYFSHSDFEPFYKGKGLDDMELAKETFFNKIEILLSDRKESLDDKDCFVYQQETLSVKYIKGEFNAYWDEIEIISKLEYPIAQPILFKDRIILFDRENIYIAEDGRILKQEKHDGELLFSEAEGISNKLNYLQFPEWLNIYKDSNFDKCIFSYSYIYNRLYRF